MLVVFWSEKETIQLVEALWYLGSDDTQTFWNFQCLLF